MFPFFFSLLTLTSSSPHPTVPIPSSSSSLLFSSLSGISRNVLLCSTPSLSPPSPPSPPSPSPPSPQGGQKDLKWKEALTTLFSTCAMDILITLLQKLSDVVLPVWGQRQPLTVSQANVLVLIATFALRVAQTLLSELLSSGDHQYRDTRIIGTLLSLHMVLCSAPHSTIISNAAPDVSAQYPQLLHIVFSSKKKKRFPPHKQPKS